MASVPGPVVAATWRPLSSGYRSTVKPDYPEAAHGERQRGTSLLRVLVDEAGRSKSVEINRSSGSDTLDRAAAEAIKRWRFSPARFGDKAVESWVKIPIEFRLKIERKGGFCQINYQPQTALRER
jgi:protein TonB